MRDQRRWRRTVARLVLPVAGVLVQACGSAQRFEEDLESTRVLATAAVKSALDNGGFQALMNQAVASSYSVARARLEAGGQTLTPEQGRTLESVLRRTLNEVYPRDAWEAVLMPLYQDNLTREELLAIVEFNRSPVGQKALAIQATLMTGGSSIGERLMQSRREEFSRRLTEALSRELGPGVSR